MSIPTVVKRFWLLAGVVLLALCMITLTLYSVHTNEVALAPGVVAVATLPSKAQLLRRASARLEVMSNGVCTGYATLSSEWFHHPFLFFRWRTPQEVLCIYFCDTYYELFVFDLTEQPTQRPLPAALNSIVRFSSWGVRSIEGAEIAPVISRLQELSPREWKRACFPFKVGPFPIYDDREAFISRLSIQTNESFGTFTWPMQMKSVQ